MKDALNNEIIFGNRYGYSRNENGFTYVRLGKIINSTPKGLVTMLLDSSKVALYNNELEEDTNCIQLKISIKPNMLFPI
jgi:hypothetical protein